MKQVRKRLTYANVMSSLAVFMILGGGAAIAAKTVLPKNSVGANQLKKKAVTTPKIKANAINSSKVKNGSLQVGDFKAGQLPTGPQGDRGPQGENGAAGKAGATNVVVRFAETTTNNGQNGSAQADCEPDERATGGGVEMGSGNSKNVWYFQPGGRPVPNNAQGATPTGWYSSWYNESGATDTFRVYVICASP